jgi:putative transposase
MDEPKWRQRHYPVHRTHDRDTFDGSVYFITVCTKNRRPKLANETAHKLLVEAWRSADHWLVGEYMILPDHVHHFCARGCIEAVEVTNWVKYWKSYVSCRWPNPDQQPIWQQQFWDTRLREPTARAKWEYVAENPVRHRLVDRSCEWPFQGKLFDVF